MTTIGHTQSLHDASMATDERREWIRVDDHLLMECRLASESPDAPQPGAPPLTDDMIAAAVGKPTADLLARSGDALASSPLLPWIMKVDWLMEVLLRGMAHIQPNSISIARLTEVNISGGGISFISPRAFQAEDLIILKLILPPFTPVHATAKVIRTSPLTGAPGYLIATQFVELTPDHHEHIIRHIIQTQAERLRARRQHNA
ncbi:MAG: PilZ domain-containing protein [Nitrospira sp.]